MTAKEIYCTGRAEALQENLGISLLEGYKIAESEWKSLTISEA